MTLKQCKEWFKQQPLPEVCKRWSKKDLQHRIYHLMFFANMIHLATHNEPLFEADWYAMDWGCMCREPKIPGNTITY